MTNEQMRESGLRLAGKILREAERHHAEGTLGLAVSPSQDVVEI